MELNKVKLRRGLAGLVAGLIAAIALLAIALPVMMQYQQHITKSYHIKEYATMLEKQKEIEEKGLATCFNQDEGVISINNTLGTPVRIVMVYATDGSQSQKYFNASGYVIKPGVNRIPLSKFGITISPENIKTIKLVTSRGTIIQPPYCREIVKIVTYEQVIEYIVKKLQGFPVNLYLGEEQIPTGISPELYGSLFVHGYLDILNNGTIYLVNGTGVNRITFKFKKMQDLIDFLDTVISGRDYGCSFYLYVREYLSTPLVLERYEVGDTIAMVVDAQTSSYDSDDEGCYNVVCRYWSTSEYFYSEKTEFTIKRMAINYVTKPTDNDPEQLTYDPIEYLLVNCGYNYLIVGIQCEKFDPVDEGINAFSFSGEIYLSSSKTPPTDLENSDLKILFSIEYSISGGEVSLDNIYAEVFKRENQNWVSLGEPRVLYRDGYSLMLKGFTIYRVFKMIDQVVFIIDNNLIHYLNLEPGDSLWITAKARFIIDGSDVYEDIYGLDAQEWYKYIYTPLKQIVDSWNDEYFGG